MSCIEFLKNKINTISISSKGGSKERIFKKDFFSCGGFTNSPIDIHKSNLELSHLCETTSLDLCLI